MESDADSPGHTARTLVTFMLPHDMKNKQNLSIMLQDL